MKHNAFTLIELLVVAAVISVLAGLAVSSFHGSAGKTTLDESARRLHIAMRYARHYAVTHQQACRVVLIVKGGGAGGTGGGKPGYRLEIASIDPDKQEAYTVLRGGAGKATNLPLRVRFAEVLIEGADGGEGHVITFQPTGEADAAVIQLTDDRRTWSILIEPNTGRAKRVNRAVNQTLNMREDLDA